ncbi:Glu-tRNA(Gln) amidotransferase subunit GatD [Candidatus Woesearchaeota archaeon]|nr:Glu-tRNA(Gln) amidotransferase subunit GatD [Candidatus Woesearchaeota archaeon]
MNMKPEPGDIVKVRTKDETYEGILMPRPEIFEKGYVIIKLDNGYNIGVDEKRISRIELVSKYHMPSAPEKKITPKKNLPNVSILSFGGTISSKVDYKTGGVYAAYSADDFVQMVPELGNIANLKAEQVMKLMSEDMVPEHWKAMAESIANELNKEEVAGVVVTHGTDTLHFSTAAMSFFLKNLNKPVVFTASQRSIDRGSSDAFSNLLCAVNAAANFDGAAVVTCLHGTTDDNYCTLNRGTKVRKLHSSRRDAFRPINELPLAKVFEDGKIEVLNNDYSKRSAGKVEVDNKFESKTALVYVYPGMENEVLDYYIKNKFKGIVIAATGLGHVAGLGMQETYPKHSLYKKIKELNEGKIAVVITTQTLYGRVHPYVYTNLRKLSMELNCIFAEDMLPETAYVKLGWVLGHVPKIEEVKKMMLTNYAGEITERSDARGFLY